jgi:predicted acylesterase/phospholipase RssA
MDEEPVKEKRKIQHLVISGGGPSGLFTYGAAAYLAKQKFWSLADIKSIYGCSIGAYMGVVFSLGYDWDWLDDYFIQRPWEKVVAQSSVSLIDIYEKKGLLNEQFIFKAIEPLLRAKDLPETITLKEFYEFNHIDIHLYTTNINNAILEKVDISHTTHPNLTLIKALQMTMCFPIMFQPICENGECYIDGGLLNNYPLNDCITQQKCAHEEILAFKNIWASKRLFINEESSLLDFLLVLMKKMQASLDTEPEQEDIKHTMRCLIEDLDGFDNWVHALSEREMREKSIEKGAKQAELFLLYI